METIKKLTIILVLILFFSLNMQPPDNKPVEKPFKVDYNDIIGLRG